ncbi:MAG TPA: hypothetical protein VMM92_01125 [Thermoanaerobaculia bacterium]|nr:hypothetical protein [Thermoanaerobaculia bacterium]
MSDGLKVASVHVRATAEQAERWNRAAAAEGHGAAATWLAEAAEVLLMDGTEVVSVHPNP